MATQEKKMATPTSTLNVSTGAHAKRIARQLQHIDTQVSRHSFRDEAIQKNEATRGQMSPVGPQRSPTYREKVHEQRCRNARKKRDFADRVEVMAAAAVARELGDASTCSISPRSAQIVAEAVATKQVGDVSTSKVSPRSARIKRLVEKGPRTAQSARDLLHHFNKKAEKAQARRKLYKVDSSLSNLSMLPQNEDASATAPDLVPEQVAPSALPVAPYTICEKVLFTMLLALLALLIASMASSAQYSNTIAELKGQFEATVVRVENFAEEIQVLNAVNIKINNADKAEMLMLQEQVTSLAKGKETVSEWLSQKDFELMQKNGMLAQKNSELLQKEDELVQMNSELAKKNTELAESQRINEERRQAHKAAYTQATHDMAHGYKTQMFSREQAHQETTHAYRNQIHFLEASTKTAQMGIVLCNMQLDDVQMKLNSTMWVTMQHMFGMQM